MTMRLEELRRFDFTPGHDSASCFLTECSGLLEQANGPIACPCRCHRGTGTPCGIAGCFAPVSRMGFCEAHAKELI